MSSQTKIAFIGLGVMGAPMARHLAAAGHAITAYHRTPARAQAWQGACADLGLEVATAPSPAEASRDADTVFTCVGNDEDLAEVVLGSQGALDAMAPGSLLVDHTTVSADMARRIDAAAKARGLAGTRVGYALGSTEVIRWLRPTDQPWRVGSVLIRPRSPCELTGWIAGASRHFGVVPM